jgi:hypothetical protein
MLSVISSYMFSPVVSSIGSWEESSDVCLKIAYGEMAAKI